MTNNVLHMYIKNLLLQSLIELDPRGICAQLKFFKKNSKARKTKLQLFYSISSDIRINQIRHHVVKHIDPNAIFQILYLCYSRLKPLRPYVQYALRYIQLLSTECGDVLYIV